MSERDRLLYEGFAEDARTQVWRLIRAAKPNSPVAVARDYFPAEVLGDLVEATLASNVARVVIDEAQQTRELFETEPERYAVDAVMADVLAGTLKQLTMVYRVSARRD